ncbi:MAG: hypothetical protein KGN16_24305 [Burkholderiales bacterium]|nr:hypothetical protein [Burkholderiales bacterium]
MFDGPRLLSARLAIMLLLLLLAPSIGWAGGPPSNWTARTSGTTQTLYGVAYGGGTYVAVGARGTIVTSPDGVTWTASNAGTTAILYGVTYSPGWHAFVAVGDHVALVSNDNGKTWTSQTVSKLLRRVTSGWVNGIGIQLVAVGGPDILAVHYPWSNWSAQPSPAGANNLLGVASTGEAQTQSPEYVVVGANGQVFTSADSKTWTPHSCGFSGGMTAVTGTGGAQNFVAVGDLFAQKVTTDVVVVSGLSCSSAAFPAHALNGMTFGDGYVVAVGFGSITYSGANDFWNWTTMTVPPSLNDVSWGGATFVAVGDNGAIYQSVPQASTVAGYQGCYTDDATRALPVQLMQAGATPASCVAAAKAKGYAYAGVQYKGACFAGDAAGYTKVPDNPNCQMKCDADASSYCGGAWFSSVYATGVSPPNPPVAVYKGCLADHATRTLPVTLWSTSTATKASCVAAARARGLLYAGLQFGGQCYGGNVLPPGPPDESKCTMKCNSNSGEPCGGTWYNSVYATGATQQPMPPRTADNGCWQDDPDRALPVSLIPSGATVESCVAAAKAKGYAYAGLQYYGQCYAGDALGRRKVADQSACNTPCTASPTPETCGGGWLNSIWSTK